MYIRFSKSFSKEIEVDLGSKVHLNILKLFSIVGIMLLILSGYMARATFEFLKDAKVTSAVVVDIVGINRNPVFKYYTLDGKVNYFTSVASSKPPRYQVGDDAELLIDTNSRKKLENHFFAIWGWELILGFIGLGFVGMSFFHYKSCFFKKNINL
jgi:hypothetical protein